MYFFKALKCYVLTLIPPGALINKPQMTVVLTGPVTVTIELPRGWQLARYTLPVLSLSSKVLEIRE